MPKKGIRELALPTSVQANALPYDAPPMPAHSKHTPMSERSLRPLTTHQPTPALWYRLRHQYLQAVNLPLAMLPELKVLSSEYDREKPIPAQRRHNQRVS